MKLFGIKTCDTCRKALKELANAGHEVEFVDIRETPLTEEQIAAFLEVLGDGLLNTRSTTWRGLHAEARARAPLALLKEHPTLMKRPVIETEQLFLGWSKDVRAALL